MDIPLLTDWDGAAIRALGVEREVSGMRSVPTRSAFLIEDGRTIRAAWLLGSELPDVDAVLAAAG